MPLFEKIFPARAEQERREKEIEDLAKAKAMQELFENQRKNTPVFSMGDLSGSPREMPGKTQSDLQALFDTSYGDPDARLRAIDEGLKRKTAQLSYEQKPVFTSSEFEKATEGIKQLREQKDKQPKPQILKSQAIAKLKGGGNLAGYDIIDDTPPKESGNSEDAYIAKMAARDLQKQKSEAFNAKNNIGNIRTALDLVDKGVTGKSGQVKAFLAPYAESLGVNTEGMDDAQTYQLLTRVIIGPMRLDIVGPGPVSEWEQKMMQLVSGGGGAGKKAAKQLLNYYQDLAVNKIKKYNSDAKDAYYLNENFPKLFKPFSLTDNRPEQKPEVGGIPGTTKSGMKYRVIP